MNDVRLAWVSTHPIQYQAPLLRAIASQPGIQLTALFFSDFSVNSYVDREFGHELKWDVPLLEGYKHEFLPSRTPRTLLLALKERLSRRHFDVVLVQGWSHYGYPLAAWLAKRAGLKVLMRCEATRPSGTARGLRRASRSVLVRWLLNQVDFFLAIGTRNREFYLSAGIPATRIGSMPYAVDNDFFRARAAAVDRETLRSRLALDPGRPVLLYASKLTARKRANDLLDAYRRLSKDGGEPRPYLLFVGDGELRQSLERTVEQLKWQSVRFLGFKNQRELPEYYALADVFVLPSFNENWGLVVNEAMNAGCAVVVSDEVGSGADLVDEGVNGAKFRAGDVVSLTDALERVLKNDLYRKMGCRSLERIGSWGLSDDISGLRDAIHRLALTPKSSRA